jgi:putative hemolysin
MLKIIADALQKKRLSQKLTCMHLRERYIVLFLGLVFIVIAKLDTALAMINPSAAYCRALGYTYSSVQEEGGEQGYCRISESQIVNAWEFLQGRVVPEYSYCKQQGYEIKNIQNSEICEERIFASKCAFCVLQDGSEAEMTALMNLSFAEGGCGDGFCTLGAEHFGTCPQDCPSGGSDGYCDGVADGKCDPDCQAGQDSDCAAPGYLGDLNKDGSVDISDVILVLRIALQLDPQVACSDINADGGVDIADVILTLRMALELDPNQLCT